MSSKGWPWSFCPAFTVHCFCPLFINPVGRLGVEIPTPKLKGLKWIFLNSAQESLVSFKRALKIDSSLFSENSIFFGILNERYEVFLY